jgi:hypothetical protein
MVSKTIDYFTSFIISMANSQGIRTVTRRTMLCNVNPFRIHPVSNVVECKTTPSRTLYNLSSEVRACWSTDRGTTRIGVEEAVHGTNDSDIAKIREDCKTLTDVKHALILNSFNTRVNEHTTSNLQQWADGIGWSLNPITLSFLTFMCKRGLNLIQCGVPVGKRIVELGTTIDQLWRCEKTATWVLVDLRTAPIELSDTGTHAITDSYKMEKVIMQCYASTTTRPRWVRYATEMCIQKWLFAETFKVVNTSGLVVIVPEVSVHLAPQTPDFESDLFQACSLAPVWKNIRLIRVVLALLRAHRKQAHTSELELEIGTLCLPPSKLGKRQIECIAPISVAINPGARPHLCLDDLRSSVQASSCHLAMCSDPIAWFQWVHALLLAASGAEPAVEWMEHVTLSINSHVATLRYLLVSQFTSLYSLPATVSGFSIITAGFLALGYGTFWPGRTLPPLALTVSSGRPVFTSDHLRVHLLELDTHLRSLLLYKPDVLSGSEPNTVQAVKQHRQFTKFTSPRLYRTHNYLAHDLILRCKRLVYLTHCCTPDTESTHDPTTIENTICVLDECAYVWVHMQVTAKLIASMDNKWSSPPSCIHNIHNLLSKLIKIEPDVTMRNAFMDLVYTALSCNALYERYRRKQGMSSSAKPPVMIVLQECVPAKELHQVLVELNTRTMQQLYVRQCDWYEWMQLSLISSMVLIRFRVDIVKTYLVTGSEMCTEYNRIYNSSAGDYASCANRTRAIGPRIYNACGIWGIIFAPHEPIPCGSYLDAFALWLGIWGVYFEGVTEEGFSIQLLIEEVFHSATSNWEECVTSYINNR